MKMWIFVALWVLSWVGVVFLVYNRSNPIHMKMRRAIYLLGAIGILLFGFFLYYMHKFFDHLKEYKFKLRGHYNYFID
jgi:hypothetical protein